VSGLPSRDSAPHENNGLVSLRETNGNRASAIAHASFEQALDAMLVVDTERVYTDANPAACALLGLERSEVVGRRIDDFMPPEVLPSISAAWEDFLKTGEQSGEYELVVADGSRRRIEFRAKANVLPGLHLSVLRDITERRAAEEALRAQRAIDSLSAVLEHLGDGLYVSDREGRMTFVNPAACTVLGYGSPEDLIGSSAHETIHYKRPNGSGFPRDECPLVSVFQSGEMLSGEEWFVRQDGSMVPVSYTCSPLPLAEGRGTVVAFRDQSERKAAKEKLQRDLDALSWIGRVRDALDEGRMVLHAQPIVELSTREVTQHELLLRMVDRDNGLVLPGRFLPIAERYGLAPEVDRWVIRRALTVPKEIGTVEINLSAASFGDLDLLGAIERGLTDTDVDPACVVFEITETALMEQIETGQRFARRLEELGCRLTLDDFGTGYGSFTYLKELPISFLKIDMQFIRGICRDVGNQRVVEAIVSLSKAFGQQTIAEGVEDEATAVLLHRLGVDFGQGHEFGLAQPLEA